MKEVLLKNGNVSYARIIGAVVMVGSFLPWLVWAWTTIEHSGHGHAPVLGWKAVVALWVIPFGIGLGVFFGRGREMLDAAIERLGGENGDG